MARRSINLGSAEPRREVKKSGMKNPLCEVSCSWACSQVIQVSASQDYSTEQFPRKRLLLKMCRSKLFSNLKVKVNTLNSATNWKVTQKDKQDAWLWLTEESEGLQKHVVSCISSTGPLCRAAERVRCWLWFETESFWSGQWSCGFQRVSEQRGGHCYSEGSSGCRTD